MSLRLPLLTACGWLFGVLLASCGSSDATVAPTPMLPEVIEAEEVTLNPTGVAPLSALLELETTQEVTLALRVAGRRGSESDVVHEIDEPATAFEVPILGLYPDSTNEVDVTLSDASDRELATRTYSITTGPRSPDLPDVDVEVPGGPDMGPGFTLVSYWGHREGVPLTPHRPIMIDRFGDVRWYLDFTDHPELKGLHYDVGVERLTNGNLYFGDQYTRRIYEVTMLGEVVNTWDMPGFGFHHNVQEKPDGNFLVTVNKRGEPTLEDHIIEIDRQSGEIVNVWDLRESLDYDRTALSESRIDWFHANSVIFDERDGTIIVSGRNQGLAKLTESNEVVWILSPHKGWGTSGTGVDLNQFLLQPVDAEGRPIEDQFILDGFENHEDFEWPWRPHSPFIMPDGDLLVFDNGDSRNFGSGDLYSRGVEYRIDEDAMTVQQVWSYATGIEGYSPIVSDVDYLADEDRVILSSGAITYGTRYGKIIEVDYPGQEVTFQVRITAPVVDRPFITFHRSERLPIYPPSE